jgi:hypothetical protein
MVSKNSRATTILRLALKPKKFLRKVPYVFLTAALIWMHQTKM